jgi:hypothetical protein
VLGSQLLETRTRDPAVGWCAASFLQWAEETVTRHERTLEPAVIVH